jgi:hypothetical protein
MVKSASTKALAPWMAEFVGTPACLEGIDAMRAGRMMRRALERSRVCTPRARARARVRARGAAERASRESARGSEAAKLAPDGCVDVCKVRRRRLCEKLADFCELSERAGLFESPSGCLASI